ncbi:transcriptional regulator [Haloechinothrix salitolerans]|uniref:Transcriptional regulator n=1 Tax=Haloechinothrix salitolerans TaxID=926830 RepID=A0ABW2C4H1_9PSEU
MTTAVFGAVAPGTDLSTHARELQRIHDAVLGGARPPTRPRALVARSWSRMMAMGLDPDRNAREHLPAAEIERLRHESPLSQVIDELRTVLTSVADASQFLMVVCDAEGIVLWREGSARVRIVADQLGFVEGARWTEQVVGTNAIGTALTEHAPVELFSAEHFEHTQHPWYCTAAPVHDPRSGDLLGVVDVSGPALTLHPAIGSLVRSAVRLAEARLWRLHQDQLDRLRRETEPLLGTRPGPLLVVDDHGWVAHHSGIAAKDRIEVPRANRALAVPGMGLCLPERITDGWLIRPRDQQGAITARLDLTGEPVLEVRSDEAGWRTSLTPRHAQLLRALSEAGSDGLSAGWLSTLLYGDAEHAVTVRAEVSRLRRVVGALITPNPYRLADGVTLTVSEPDSPQP